MAKAKIFFVLKDSKTVKINDQRLKTIFLNFKNKIKGLGQGFRNNKKIVQELGTKIKD